MNALAVNMAKALLLNKIKH